MSIGAQEQCASVGVSEPLGGRPRIHSQRAMSDPAVCRSQRKRKPSKCRLCSAAFLTAGSQTRSRKPLRVHSLPVTVGKTSVVPAARTSSCSRRSFASTLVKNTRWSRLFFAWNQTSGRTTRANRSSPRAARRRNVSGLTAKKGCNLCSRVVPLDHAVTCKRAGSAATSRLLVRSSTGVTICLASSFGFSYSGQSSRNSFCRRYVCRSPSCQYR
jgi:hypothetical protein